MACDLDPSCRRTNTARNLKEVVRLSGRAEPSRALVDADLQVVGAAFGIDDLRAEPVLGYAGLHVDFQRAVDIRTWHVVPGYVDYALGGRGELVKGVREEVEVVCSTPGALVDNLDRVSREGDVSGLVSVPLR